MGWERALSWPVDQEWGWQEEKSSGWWERRLGMKMKFISLPSFMSWALSHSDVLQKWISAFRFHKPKKYFSKIIFEYQKVTIIYLIT